MSEQAPQDLLSIPPLNTEVIGGEILIFGQIDSTNEHALNRGGEGAVFIADKQTAGRGRHGRSWHSAPGLGLWFSIAFESPMEGLLFAGALAVRDALRPFIEVTFKWPNDVLAGGKKVCGILVEHRQARSALGIGINVRHRPEDFPEELREHATSLELATGHPVERCVVLRDVLHKLDGRVKLLQSGGLEELRREWAEACRLTGRRIRFEDMEGTVADIDSTGALIIATSQGRRRLISGAVTVLSGA